MKNFAKAVVAALVNQGSMDEAAALSLLARNRGTVIAGGMLGDQPADVAHDLFQTITDTEVDTEPWLPKLRKPLRLS